MRHAEKDGVSTAGVQGSDGADLERCWAMEILLLSLSPPRLLGHSHGFTRGFLFLPDTQDQRTVSLSPGSRECTSLPIPGSLSPLVLLFRDSQDYKSS